MGQKRGIATRDPSVIGLPGMVRGGWLGLGGGRLHRAAAEVEWDERTAAARGARWGRGAAHQLCRCGEEYWLTLNQ